MILVTVAVVWQNVFLPEPNLAISLLTFAIFALTWIAHRANIERLIIGKERETNIQAKIRHDQKKHEKLEQKQVKIDIKEEIKQEKQIEKQQKQSVKAQIKQAKKHLKKNKKHKLKFKSKKKKKK